MLLWAGLLHKNPTITPTNAGIMIQEWMLSGKTLDDLSIKISEALIESDVFGKKNENDNNDSLDEVSGLNLQKHTLTDWGYCHINSTK